MTDFTRSYTTSIDAPVHTVFEYCRDPRRMFGGYPGSGVSEHVEISDVTVTPEGLGTTSHFLAKHGAVTEGGDHEYVEFVPDERIVVKVHPRVTIAGITKEITHGPVWTWTFEPEDGGTKLTVVFREEDAAWWQRAFDVVTERSWSKEIGEWLDGIKAGAEERTSRSR